MIVVPRGQIQSWRPAPSRGSYRAANSRRGSRPRSTTALLAIISRDPASGCPIRRTAAMRSVKQRRLTHPVPGAPLPLTHSGLPEPRADVNITGDRVG